MNPKPGIYFPPDDPTKPPPPYDERPMACRYCHAPVLHPDGHDIEECFNVLHSRIAALEARVRK